MKRESLICNTERKTWRYTHGTLPVPVGAMMTVALGMWVVPKKLGATN